MESFDLETVDSKNWYNTKWLNFKWFLRLHFVILRSVTFPLLIILLVMTSSQGRELFLFYLGDIDKDNIRWFQLIVSIVTMIIWCGVNYRSTHYVLSKYPSKKLYNALPELKKTQLAKIYGFAPFVVFIISLVIFLNSDLIKNFTSFKSKELKNNIYILLLVLMFVFSGLNYGLKVFSKSAISKPRNAKHPENGNRISFRSPFSKILNSSYFHFAIMCIFFFLIALIFSLSFQDNNFGFNKYARPSTFGSFAIVFSFMAFFVYFLSKITSASDRLGVPFTFILFLYIAAGGYLRGGAQIEYIKEDGKIKVAEQKLRPLEESINFFEKTRSENSPTFLVATAGGGIRAAYFTSAVLQAFCELSGPKTKFPNIDFNNNLLAISGVSGGTLGAAIYKLDFPPSLSDNYEAIHIKMDTTDNGMPHNINPECQKHIDSAHLWPDYLADILGGFLFSEMAQKFTNPIICSLNKNCDQIWFQDRGNVLAKSWSFAWNNALSGDVAYDWKFFHRVKPLQSDGVRNEHSTIFPIFIANSTDALTGKRVLTANADLGSTSLDIIDFFDVASNENGLPNQITLPQVILNSARFSYITPVGITKSSKNISSHSDQASSGGALIEQKLKLVDGGYFENYGAETALEVARNYTELSDNRLVVIQISNYYEAFSNFNDDPETIDCVKTTKVPYRRLPHKGAFYDFFGEITSPISGYLATREARGILATKRLKCFMSENYTRDIKSENNTSKVKNYFHVNFESSTKAPLGWSISKSTRDELKKLAQRKVIKILEQIKSNHVK